MYTHDSFDVLRCIAKKPALRKRLQSIEIHVPLSHLRDLSAFSKAKKLRERKQINMKTGDNRALKLLAYCHEDESELHAANVQPLAGTLGCLATAGILPQPFNRLGARFLRGKPQSMPFGAEKLLRGARQFYFRYVGFGDETAVSMLL